MNDKAKIAALREALEDILGLAEYQEQRIEGEWGTSRSIEKIEEDGDLNQEIIAARKALDLTADDAEQAPRYAEELARNAARYEFVRTMTPRAFVTVFERNLAGDGVFDELIDLAIKARQPKTDWSAS